MAALEGARVLHTNADLIGGKAKLLRGRAKGLEIIAIDAPHLYDRPGNPYLGPDGKDWPDNARRFAALARTAADLASAKLGGGGAGILHCHDWQAALAPVYVKFGGGPQPVKTLMTVHNIAFQGQFPAELLASLGLPFGRVRRDEMRGDCKMEGVS
jgi:starch synthase